MDDGDAGKSGSDSEEETFELCETISDLERVEDLDWIAENLNAMQILPFDVGLSVSSETLISLCSCNQSLK